MIGFFLSVIFLIFCLGCVIYTLARGGGGKKSARHDDSKYARTGCFMDFDPGVDSNKVGDPKHPNAGMDSVLKHEFMNELLDGGKN